MYATTHKTADGYTQKIALAFRYHYSAAGGYSGLSEFGNATIQVWYCELTEAGAMPDAAAYWKVLGGFRWQSNPALPEEHPDAKYAHNRRGHIQPSDARHNYEGRVTYGPLYGSRLDYVEKDYGSVSTQFAAAATLAKLWAKLEQIVTKYNLSYRWPDDEFCPIVAAARVLGIADLEIDEEYSRNVYNYPRFEPYLKHSTD